MNEPRKLTWQMLSVMARFSGRRLEQHGSEYWIKAYAKLDPGWDKVYGTPGA